MLARNINITANEKKIEVLKKSVLEEMDVGIKFFIILIFFFVAVTCKNLWSLIVMIIFSGFITAFSGIKKNAVIKIFTPLIIVLLLPYLFGVLVSEATTVLQSENFFPETENLNGMLLKILRFALVGYLWGIYICTTSIYEIASFFDKLFLPLKLLGIHITDYLRVLIIIVNEINESANDFKELILKEFKMIKDKNGRKIKGKLKSIADIIVSLIVDSFQKIHKIQNTLEDEKAKNLDGYMFGVSKSDMFGTVVCVMTIVIIIIIEVKVY